MVPPGPQYIGKDNEQVVEQLFKENTFTIRRKIRPPTSTEIAHLPQPPNPRPLFLAPVDTYTEHPFGTLMNNYPQLERTKELPLMRETSGLSVSTLSVHVDPAIQNESPAHKNDF